MQQRWLLTNTMILLQVLSRAACLRDPPCQVTAFVYQQKSPIKLYIFRTCPTLSIIIRVGILCISRVFRRIFTHISYDPRPLTQRKIFLLRALAKWLASRTRNPRVVGSNPNHCYKLLPLGKVLYSRFPHLT